MTFAIFYNSNKKVIGKSENIEFCPQMGDHIILNVGKEYVVTLITHDYENKCIHVLLRQATKNDFTFLGI